MLFPTLREEGAEEAMIERPYCVDWLKKWKDPLSRVDGIQCLNALDFMMQPIGAE